MHEGGQIIEEINIRCQHDEFKDLYHLEQKYGKHIEPELMDDFDFSKKLMEMNDNLSIFEIGKRAKRFISFTGLFFTNAEQELISKSLDSI